LDLVATTCAKSEQFGAPTFPGRNYVVGLKFGYVLEDTERCPTPISWPDWTLSSWKKGLARFCAMVAI